MQHDHESHSQNTLESRLGEPGCEARSLGEPWYKARSMGTRLGEPWYEARSMGTRLGEPWYEAGYKARRALVRG